MSDQNPERQPEEERQEIADPDDVVDRKIKDRIVKARNRIDEAEKEFFVNQLGKTNPRSLNSRQRTEYELTKRHYADRWGILVRQYIRSVKTLLTNDEISHSREYWKNRIVYKSKIAPPDQDDYEWSRFVLEDDPMQTAERMGLPLSFDPPEAKLVEIVGLKELMDKEKISLSWHIKPRPDKMPPKEDDRYVDIDRPLPKKAYENAIELTDDFLDQAGIGLGVKEDEPDDGFLDL